MMTALRRIGRAVLMGLAWAVAWAPVAVLIGIGIVDPDNFHDEMWVAIGAYPGFISGAIFYALVGIAGRRLAELTLSRAALLGAAAGLPVGVFPFLIGEPTMEVPIWKLAGGFMSVVVVLSAVSAVCSVLVARALSRRRLQGA